MAIEKTSVNDILTKNYAEFDLGLLCEEAYKSLKHIDMVVYTLLNNQHGLSVKTTLSGSKRYVDKNGFIFVSIGQDKLCKLLRTTKPTLNASLKRLQELDLVEVVSIGNMKCNRMYVGKLKRTLTLGDYMQNMNIEEEINEPIPTIDVLNIEEAKKIAENKKASSTAIDEAQNINISKSNNSINKSIPQNNKKDTKKSKTIKNKFNNGTNNHFENYGEKELEDLLKESLKEKFKDLKEGAIKFKANYMSTMNKS